MKLIKHAHSTQAIIDIGDGPKKVTKWIFCVDPKYKRGDMRQVVNVEVGEYMTEHATELDVFEIEWERHEDE